MTKPLLMLLDGNSLINRAYFGLAGRSNLTAPDGTPTGALLAFLNMLIKYITDYQPTHICAAFDRPEPTFRHTRYAEYKSARKPMPDALATQMPYVKELLDGLAIARIEMPGYEADDLIGTLAVQGAAQGMSVLIVTGDRDSFQLIREDIRVLLPVTRSGKSRQELFDRATFQEVYGIAPEQVIDLKAIMGDASDQIPGVKGIGEKGATDLIQTYGSLEAIYQQLAEVPNRYRQKLADSEELAWLSQELATIDCQVPLPDDLINMSDYSPAHFKPELTTLLLQLGFHNSLKKIESWVQAAGASLQTAEGPDEASAIPQLDALPDSAFDAGQGPAAFLLTAAGGIVFLPEAGVVSFETAEAPSLRRWLWESPRTKVTWGYKLQFRSLDWPALPQAPVDVEIAAYLLNQLDSKPDLTRLIQRVLNRVPPAAAATSGSQISLLESDDAASAALETWQVCQLPELAEQQQAELLATDQLQLAEEIEYPLAAVLLEMERAGILLDRQGLEHMSREMAEEIESLQTQIFEAADGTEFNIQSPKQLNDVLYHQLGLKPGRKRPSGIYSTDNDELERLYHDHRIIPLIIQFRAVTKLRSTFVENLRREMSPQDGRVRTTYQQTLTSTGRLSSINPNLQNIPVRTAQGRAIRNLFVAAPGKILLDADYSQIELRLLAHLSGDKNLKKAFHDRQDIHKVTAMRLFQVGLEQVTPEMRAVAKTMNFSIVYGISDFGLARDLGVPVAKAHHFIEQYDQLYPDVRGYLLEQVAFAKQHGYVCTLMNRKRMIPELKSSNYNVRQFGERAAMNAPVQGTAADLIKIAMVDIARRFAAEAVQADLLMQVHDELIVEADLADADRAAHIIESSMEAAMQLDVPLEATVQRGHSWGEAKED